jgi:hypothetical protein
LLTFQHADIQVSPRRFDYLGVNVKRVNRLRDVANGIVVHFVRLGEHDTV